MIVMVLRCSLFSGRSCREGLSARRLRGKVRAGDQGPEHSVYGVDNKSVVGLYITGIYFAGNSISKKYYKRRKILENGEKRRAYILYFRKNAYLCSPFWTMEIDFLTIKGQF
ncbi:MULTISPECIES: hypothetical protein [Alistipes]|jgi:hypothetical protein|uniref:hypothetical protein n=1 Tax=Alistipes TaxID=239759 RepID=UPI001C3787B3|nr:MULTISPECIES: hypothetical protein [Alistipes]MBV4294987.1 hypothetical protein [Alistipes shahii]